jgi:hypothetical protein
MSFRCQQGLIIFVKWRKPNSKPDSLMQLKMNLSKLACEKNKIKGRIRWFFVCKISISNFHFFKVISMGVIVEDFHMHRVC